MKLEDVLAAHARIRPFIHKTPLLTSRQLNAYLGLEVFIKAENVQKTGAFKARGAMHFVFTHADQAEVFTTYSSGNHGQALTWAAAQRKRSAVIFMPEDASPVKVSAVKGYGGEVRFAGKTSYDRKDACEAFAKETGAMIVPPFDHPHIIAGQGTTMLEVLEDLPIFDVALVPAGGGGLISGCALVLKSLRQNSEIFACEPELADDVAKSLESGERQAIEFPNTIADGLRNLCMGDLNWAIIKSHVDGGLLCSEDAIKRAMMLYATLLKQVVEPSGAATLACLMMHRERFKDKKVVIILSGGNTALKDYARLVTEHDFDF